MPKKIIPFEERVTDLLEKILIIELHKLNVPQKQIKAIVNVGSEKITPITKFAKITES